MKIAVLVSGTGSNLQAIMDSIACDSLPNVEICLVAGNKADAYGIERARQAGLPTATLQAADFATREQYDAALVELIKQSGAELVCLAGYMRLVTTVFLQAFPQRVINIHPALLPSFPGLHGQQQAFDYGVKFSGCTVHFVDDGMDSGTIIAQRVVPVLPQDTADTLAARILEQEHLVYSQVIGAFAENKIRLDAEGKKAWLED